ncbi:MAG: site-specific integrase [Candidatus Woesearchaeota archaeon]|nr:site-specific integrase [Candidatus Woesearchaeota archaeon]
MAENDIYNNEKRYSTFKADLEHYLEPPEGKRKYQIKNKKNLGYFKVLIKKFEARDISFIRRIRLLRSFLIVTFVIEKDLMDASREDIDRVMGYFSKQGFSPKTRSDFVIDLKFIWKQILPEKDEKGRIDDALVPYVVRHINGKMDKSRERRREDRLSIEEFEKLVTGFGDDIRMQALLTLALESLGRPQELLYLRIKDVELHDNFAKIWVSEHGKEGTKFLECIDSFPYVAGWYSKHPLKKDPNALFFITMGNQSKYKQLNPHAVNKHIRNKCKLLGISKPITFYSLKRSGITIRRLRGDSDVTIQHTAGWTSTKQLKIYDQSQHEDSFKMALVKRGKIESENELKDFRPLSKKCIFCGVDNGIGESICRNCRRPLDREVIERDMKEKENEIKDIREKLNKLEKMYEYQYENPKVPAGVSQLKGTRKGNVARFWDV